MDTHGQAARSELRQPDPLIEREGWTWKVIRRLAKGDPSEPCLPTNHNTNLITTRLTKACKKSTLLGSHKDPTPPESFRRQYDRQPSPTNCDSLLPPPPLISQRAKQQKSHRQVGTRELISLGNQLSIICNSWHKWRERKVRKWREERSHSQPWASAPRRRHNPIGIGMNEENC